MNAPTAFLAQQQHLPPYKHTPLIQLRKDESPCKKVTSD